MVCDLDGVVYRGPDGGAARRRGAPARCTVPVLYATNNASRSPADVAAHLRELGLDVRSARPWPPARRRVPGCSPTGWRPAARCWPWAVPACAAALDGGRAAARAARARPRGAAVDAVLQGYGPAVTATDLAEAAYAVEGGATWVATNTDGTLPTDRGVAPGNGSLVAAVERAVGHPPHLVAGKPRATARTCCAPGGSTCPRTGCWPSATGSTPTSRVPWPRAWTRCWC